MFNCRHQCFPPSLFFPSSPLQLDSCNKSLMEPGSNQHPAKWREKACGSPAAFDNTLSGYQTCSVMPHSAWWWDLGSDWVSWEWRDLTLLYKSVTPSIHCRTFLSWQVSVSENGWHLGPSHDSRWLFVQYKRQHTGLVVTMTAWKDRWGGWHTQSPQVEVLMKSLAACLVSEDKQRGHLQIN